MPPVGPKELVGTQTVNDTVAAAASNLMKELFWRLKQLSSPELGQSCTVLPVVFPQRPLKSHTAVALVQDDVPGRVVEHAGMEGGSGAGVLLNDKLHDTSEPALLPFRLS